MKDFSHWLANQASPVDPIEAQLEDIGCRQRAGKWVARCRSCEGDIPIEDYCSLQEWLDQPRYNDLCGGSPRCLP